MAQLLSVAQEGPSSSPGSRQHSPEMAQSPNGLSALAHSQETPGAKGLSEDRTSPNAKGSPEQEWATGLVQPGRDPCIPGSDP